MEYIHGGVNATYIVAVSILIAHFLLLMSILRTHIILTKTHKHSHTPSLSPSLSLSLSLSHTHTHTHTHTQPLTPQITRSATSRDPNWNRKKQARIIANRLKIFGDEISSTHEAEIQREFARLITTHSPQEVIAAFSSQLRHMLLGLSWQNIGKVFHLSYHLLEFLTALLGPSVEDTGRPEWREFSELWDLTLSSVTRWISINGGWVSIILIFIICIHDVTHG